MKMDPVHLVETQNLPMKLVSAETCRMKLRSKTSNESKTVKSKACFAALGVALSSIMSCAPSSPSTQTGKQAPYPSTQPSTRVEGTVDGGGGKGVICDGQVRTLDLYEAEFVHHLPIARSEKTLDDNVFVFGMELGRHRSEESDDIVGKISKEEVLKVFKEEFDSKTVWLPRGARLKQTNDATLPSLPSNCQHVQIAIYTKDDKIFLDQEYWEKLSPQDQAALVLHEWVYLYTRNFGAHNSDETRRVIGMIFARQNPEPLFSPIWGAREYSVCLAGGGYGEIYEIFVNDEVRDSVKGVAMYFRAFKGEYMMSRTTAFLPGASIQDFMAGKVPAAKIPVENKIRNQKWTLEFGSWESSDGIQIKAYSADQTPPPASVLRFCSLHGKDHPRKTGPVEPVVVVATPEPIPTEN